MDATALSAETPALTLNNGGEDERFTVDKEGDVSAYTYKSFGLTGATSATRYVGGTATVAPATGTFSTGDWVVAQNGNIYICTAGGSPGTWATVGGGGTTPATTVTTLDGLQSAVVGTATNYAREDHKHAVTGVVDITSDNQIIEGQKRFESQGSSDVPLSARGSATQGVDIFRVQSNGGVNTYFRVESNGRVNVLDDMVIGKTLTVSGKTIGPQSTTDHASFNAPHGTAPTAPVNGDIWTTTAGLYIRVDGVTVGPLTTEIGTPLTTKGDLFTYTTTEARLPVGATNGQALVVDSAETTGLKWLSLEVPLVLSKTGTLTVATGQSRVGVEGSYTIVGMRARVATAPTGASVLVDVNKNGTTVFTTQGNRPSISAAATESSFVTNMDVTTLGSGDYLTVDIDQIGSTVAGADLTVTVWLRRTA